MKDTGEADVILGINIKRENKGIVITQSHYIKKILKKLNREDCSPMSTPMNPVEKLKPNTGKPVDQLEYSRAIGCLMYAMTSTRPDIAYVLAIEESMVAVRVLPVLYDVDPPDDHGQRRSFHKLNKMKVYLTDKVEKVQIKVEGSFGVSRQFKAGYYRLLKCETEALLDR
nr:zinc finger, CCHC-type [Tanacetum cinerariifolium]